MNRELHPEAYDYMMGKHGFSIEEMGEFADSEVLGEWEAKDYFAGKTMMEQTEFIVNEAGELIDMVDYMGYHGESYEDAMKRQKQIAKRK